MVRGQQLIRGAPPQKGSDGTGSSRVGNNFGPFDPVGEAEANIESSPARGLPGLDLLR